MAWTVMSPAAGYGLHSEVGGLRKVLVRAPGLAHERLTPTNCDELLLLGFTPLIISAAVRATLQLRLLLLDQLW